MKPVSQCNEDYDVVVVGFGHAGAISAINAADDDFGRPAGSMTRIATPPFYGAPVWATLSNTVVASLFWTEF